MRRLLPIACALWLLTAATAAADGPSVSADATRVPAGEKYVLEGSGWSLAPGCETAVEVSRRLGHGVPVGSAEIAEDGTFGGFMRKIPRRARVGSRIVLDVTQFCSDGTNRIGTTRTVTVRVMRHARTCPGTIAVKGRAYILETWGGLGCASAKAIGPFLDAHISPDGFDCEMTDPRVGYDAACVVQVAPRQRVTARHIREV